MSTNLHSSMEDDLQMMQNEAEKQDQHRRDLEKKAATIDRRESNGSLEFDRALIFIRTIKVRVSVVIILEAL